MIRYHYRGIDPENREFKGKCPYYSTIESVQQSGSWLFLYDNARPQIALLVKQLVASHEVVEILHPPYSPNLTPVDFSLFPKLKICCREKI